MRNLFYFLFLVIISACTSSTKSDVQQKEDKIYQRNELNELITADIKESAMNGKVQKRAILEHQMGMKKDTTYKHIRRLYKQGKLKRIQNKKGNFEYVYTLGTNRFGNVDMYFDAFFDRKKRLYMLECRPFTDGKIAPEEMIQEIESLMSDKYGKANYRYENGSCTGYVWMDQTLIIEAFCGEEDVLLQYKDGTNMYQKKNEL